MTTVAGVISEKRVLCFSSHPPSPFGAHHLPQTVDQSRGHRGFAMNQHTQLQLCLEPRSSSMATSFSTLPSPVVINKSLDAFNCVSAERLALAVRLARRHIQSGKVQSSSMTQQPLIQEQYADNNGPGNSADHHPTDDSPPNSNLHQPKTEYQCHYVNTDPPADQSDPPSHVKQKQVTIDNRSKPSPWQSVSNSSEIMRLRDELQQQVNVLKQLNGNKRTHNNPLGVKGQTSSGRVWMEEGEGSEEREQRRRSERVTRESRMVYNLKQQVVSLKHDVDQLHASERDGATQSSKKTTTVHRLAAAHRAALRTLANYQDHPSQHIPPELALLLLQLNSMSSALGLPGGSSVGLEQAIQQIKCVHDDPLVTERQPQTTVSSKQQRKKKAHSHKQSGRKGSSNHTRSRFAGSAQRKSHKPPLHRSTPASSSERSSHPSHKAPPSHLTNKHTSQPSYKAPPSHLTNRLTSQPSHKAPPSPLTNRWTGHSSHNPPPSPLTKAPPTTPIKPTLAHQSPWKPLPVYSSGKESSLDNEQLLRVNDTHDDSEQTETLCPLEGVPLSTVDNIDPLEGVPLSTVDHANIDPLLMQRKAESAITPHLSALPDQSVEQRKVSILLDRLRELESESDAIRERWTTIAYEDPLLTQSIHVDTNKEQETRKAPSLCPLTSNMLSNISKYKERYSHYLNMTGLATHGGFDPWTMAESIADSLLEDQLTSVAEEVELVCDSCIDTMYGGEFAKPPTETT